MRYRLILLIGVFLAGFGGQAAGHEIRPAYLEVTQTGDDTYDIVFKVPAAGRNQRLGIYLRLPDATEDTSEPIARFAGGSFVEVRSVRYPGGLAGQTLHIDGLRSTLTDVLVRIERLGVDTLVTRIEPSRPSLLIAGAPGRWEVARSYTALGIEHIWLGVDHLLFVTCLLWLARTPRRLLITITGFTLAHSLTLALSALGLVSVAVPPVEACIALSIVFLAREIAIGDESSLSFRYPVAVSVSFGLLHGFGFAAVLRNIGLPQNDLLTALLFFNVGVEIGQIAFVLALVVAFLALRKIAARTSWSAGDLTPATDPLTAKVVVTASYVIGAIATYWTIGRVASFWA